MPPNPCARVLVPAGTFASANPSFHAEPPRLGMVVLDAKGPVRQQARPRGVWEGRACTAENTKPVWGHSLLSAALAPAMLCMCTVHTHATGPLLFLADCRQHNATAQRPEHVRATAVRALWVSELGGAWLGTEHRNVHTAVSRLGWYGLP